MIRETVAFLVGVAAGGVAAKLYFENKYKTQAAEEIAAMREIMAEKTKAVEEETEEVGEEDNRLNHSAPIRDDEKMKTDYHSIADAYKKVAKDDPNNEPVIVTPEEYADADQKYACENLDYYVEDDMVMSNGEEVDNVAELLGEDNLKGFKESDDDTMYIRNDLFMIMYEVCKA